jgi:titin
LLLFAALYGSPISAIALAGPAAPSGLTATAVSSNQINLAWTDNASDETGFKIERKIGAAGTYVQIATVGANETSFSNISGLSQNTTHYYRVRAYNANGHSAFSNEASATTIPSSPSPPNNLTATAASNARIDLAWTDNSNNEDGFKIEIKAGAFGTYAEIATVGANVTSYSSVGLVANTQYYYRVRAFNGLGSSSYSNQAIATTLPDPPATPSGLTAITMSNTQINLAWQDNSSNETGFKIESKLNSAVTYTEIATVGANVTSYSSTGLAVNTAYNYRVRAYNAGGNSVYSNVANATTLPNTPAAPSGLAATTVSNNRIDLSWQDNATDELGFIIERKIGAGGVYGVIDTVGANVKTYSSLSLAGGTQYFYQVRAYNAGGNSAYSNAANATTKIDPPAAPSNLQAIAASNIQINLTWIDNANNEDGFKIERKIPQGGTGTYAEIARVGANVVSYSSKGLIASTEYFYRVRAFNLTGNSSYSNEASATTRPDPPAAPSNLQAAAVSNVQINLTWTDNSANETGFKIERKLSSAATYTQIALVGANVTTYLNTGLSANTAYSYRVRAYNADGHSAFSNTAEATTLPNPPVAPGGLAATTVSKNQIDLVWVDSSNNENGFKIERKSNLAATYTEIATVGANVTSYSSLGLNPNTAYFYRIRAYNTGGNSPYSNVAGATTLPNPPNAPSGLSATAVSNKRIDLAWQDNAGNELGFIIERKIGAAGAYAVIDTVGANVKTYASLGLAANTEYFYQVRAYNAGGNSAYSNAANATTQIDPPPAPSNLAATAVSNTQINLTWADNAGNEDGFKIELKIGPAGAYAEIATVGANVTSYSSTGLEVSTQYFYRVRAFNLAGNSSYSNEASATTLPDLPETPSGLRAAAVNNNQVDLTWTDNATNESGFKIERKLSSAASYTQIATVGANVTSYSNTSLTQNTAYSYRIRAFNASGNSAYSNVADATTLPNTPAGPSVLAAVAVSSSQINLSWQDNANNELGFLIRRKIGASGTYVVIDTVGANVATYSSLDLIASTQYFYQVRAYNAGGVSALSNEANATTASDPLAAPGNLTATAASSARINLAWLDNSNNETGFKIERKLGAAGTYAQIATVGANVTSYSNTGLNANGTYFYRVRAYHVTGHSDYSNEANATTLPKLPKAPGNLTATGGKGQINLAWADSSNNEDGFKIERKASPAGTFGLIATVGPNVTSYSNNNLSANTTYYYRVCAYNAGGHSSYSNEANATTLPNPPKAPGNLAATAVSNSQINLTWADSSNNEDGFKIERRLSTDAVYTEIAAVGSNVTNFSNTGLNANSKYFYRVRAFNSGGNSVYSNAANATTAGAKSASNRGDDATLPETITLAQNYPNPFSSEARSPAFGGRNPGTMISFTLPAAGKVTLQIFAETGQLVRTLVDGDLSPGIHHVRWNGRNQSGQAAAAGAYLYRLVVQGRNGEVLFAQSRSMTMLK